jgi:uncharacterized protein
MPPAGAHHPGGCAHTHALASAAPITGDEVSYYLLLYDVIEDYVERRTQFREAHLARAQQAHAHGELMMAGSFGDPVNGALLLFHAPVAATVERFAESDPYVTQGLVTAWRVHKWHEVLTSPRTTSPSIYASSHHVRTRAPWSVSHGDGSPGGTATANHTRRDGGAPAARCHPGGELHGSPRSRLPAGDRARFPRAARPPGSARLRSVRCRTSGAGRRIVSPMARRAHRLTACGAAGARAGTPHQPDARRAALRSHR